MPNAGANRPMIKKVIRKPRIHCADAVRGKVLVDNATTLYHEGNTFGAEVLREFA